MKFILLSDVHLSSRNPVARSDDTFKVGIGKLEAIYKYAQEEGAVILQAGDLFDRPRDWAAMDAMIDIIHKYGGVDMYCVLGQHDIYYRQSNAPTSIGTLHKLGLVTIITPDRHRAFIKGSDKINVYGAGWGDKVPKMGRKTAEFHILIVHAQIAIDRSEFPNAEDPIDYQKRHTGFDLILCGDIHRYFMQKKKRVIVNTGPLIRRTAETYSFTHEPCIFELDVKGKEYKLRKVIISHSPAEEVLSRSHIDNDGQTRIMLDEFIQEINEVNSHYENTIDIVERITMWMKSQSNLNKKVCDILGSIINE